MTAGPRIVGTFKRAAIRDIGIGLTLAFTAATTYYYKYYIPTKAKREEYYRQLRANRQQ
jgi:hypothetical protein